MIKDSTSDLQLVKNIQSNKNAEPSLLKLIERHSGIYLDMINSYASPGNPFIDYNELIQDKDYKIYDAAMKFDSSKGTKFSTYLGNEAKWMCLNIYNKNKRKPIFNSEFIENINPDDNIKDETVNKSLDKDSLNKILKMIKNIPDKRVNKIFNMRYIIGKNNKVMPWKQIGASMNLSIQGCINIHNAAIKQIQKNLQKEIS